MIPLSPLSPYYDRIVCNATLNAAAAATEVHPRGVDSLAACFSLCSYRASPANLSLYIRTFQTFSAESDRGVARQLVEARVDEAYRTGRVHSCWRGEARDLVRDLATCRDFSHDA